jgi:hypothetical protein
MPGQRLSTLILRVEAAGPANANHQLDIWLGTGYQRFSINNTNPWQQLLNDIAARLAQLGRSVYYSLQLQPSPVAAITGIPTEIVITATGYSPALDFQPCLLVSEITVGQVLLTCIRPVYIRAVPSFISCFGAGTGSIDLFVDNGSTDYDTYTYVWDDGVTAANRTNLPAGSYTVTVTANTGAYEVATVAVGQSPAIVLAITRQGNDLTASATGGLGPYTYAWDDGVTTATRPGVAGVTYLVTATDFRGCTQTASLRYELLRYWFSGNAIPLRLDAGAAYRADPTTKPGLRFACEVFVEPEYLSGTYQRVGPVLEQPADPDGRTTFEVQELLEPFVHAHLPVVNQAYASQASGLFRRFYLRHYEITDAGPAASVSLDDNYLVRGGLSFDEAGRTTWLTRQATQLPFLTWEPPTRTVLPDQPEYLYFMVPRAAMTEARLYVRLTFSNGTTSDYLYSTLTNVLRFEVYCLPAGFNQLRLPDFENATVQVTQWEMQVRDQDDAPASEWRTYVLNRRPVPVRRYYQYANSLGGINTLVAHGRAQRQLAIASNSGEVLLSAGYDPLAGDVRVDRKTGLETLKNYTGPRSAAQLMADQDFLLSELVVLLQPDRYQAGTVKDRTYTVADEDATRRVLEFDFVLPRTRFFTPAL